MTRLPLAALSLSLSLSLALGLALPATAQEASQLLDASQSPRPGAVAAYLRARDLAQIGQGLQDPLLVLAAVRLLHGLSLTDTPRQATPATPPRPVTSPDARALLDLARRIDAGGSQADLIDQIAREIPPPPRALRATAASLAPGQSQVWTLGFFGGVSSELAILTEAGRLEVLVSAAAEGSDPICADRGGDAQAYCSFVLAENGDLAVTVTNPGPAEARYLLLTE